MSVCLSVCLSVRPSVQSKHSLLTKGDRALILHKCIPCDKTFLSIPKFLTLWPWPWLLTYFWKNLTLAITFEPKEVGLSYFTFVFLVARPFCWNQNFLPHDLDLDFWPTFEKKLNLDHNFWTKSDRALILHVDLSVDTKIFDLVALTLTLTSFWKNLNLLPGGY